MPIRLLMYSRVV